MCACCKSRSKNFVLQELNTARYNRKQLRTTTYLRQEHNRYSQYSPRTRPVCSCGSYIINGAYLYLEMSISIYLSTWKSMIVVCHHFHIDILNMKHHVASMAHQCLLPYRMQDHNHVLIVISRLEYICT